MSDPLEVVLKATLKDATDQVTQLKNEFKDLNSVIGTVKATGTDFGNGIAKISMSNGATSRTITYDKENNKVLKTVTKTTEQSKGLGTALKTAFDVNRLYLYWNLTKRIRDGLKNIITSAMDYNETQNKFNVSMGNAKNDAIKFVDSISEAVGVAKDELMDYQSTYKNILSSLGSFTDQESEKISESLTKMALDYSSLFNVDTDNAMEKFQSALVGSIRPIRADSGYDISDATISARASELGVNRDLTEMEKRIMRIIVLMDQLKTTGAFQDLARTIESPSNQLKVLQNQLHEVGVWLGNVFMGVIGKILPYINAFVMVLKELIKMFATFVGYKGDDSTNIAGGFEVAEASSGGVASNLGKANKQAKELKKQLMGFDVLNVINSPSDSDSGSSGGGGAGGVGSIDPAILSALQDYDNLLEKVRMKASDIRDKIMDWLGFIKTANGWIKRDGITNLDKILDIIKAIGVAIATWKITSKVANLLGTLLGWNGKQKALASSIAANLTLAITGIYIAYKGIKHMLNGDITVFSVMETFLGSAAGAYGIISILSKLSKGGKALTAGKILSIAIPIAIAITVATFSYASIKKNFDKMTKEIYGDIDKNSMNILQTFNVGVKSVLYEVGSLASKAWLSIKDFFGLLTDEEKNVVDENKKVSDSIKAITQEYENQITTIKDSANEKLLDIEYSNRLYQELKNIVGANGEVQEGERNRAEFILNELNGALGTEYELNGNIIQNYQDMCAEIENIITQKKKEIEVEAYGEMYKESLKEKIQLSIEYKDAVKAHNDALKQYNDELKNGEKPSQVAIENLKQSTENLQNVQDELLNADKEVDYYATNLEAKMLESNGSIDEAKNVMNNYEYTVSEDVKSMIDSADDYSAEYSDLKDDITLDTDDMILSYQDAENEMEKMSESAETETSNIKSAFDKLETIQNALDSPLGVLLSNLNPAFGMGKILVDTAANLASKISEKLNITANISASGGGGKIGARASGGPVAVGEMFIAREAGPELVGKIGNTTSVMNNQQIVQAVSQGVAQAVSEVMNSGSGNTTVINLDGREIARTVQKRLVRNQNIYGTT